MPDASAIYKLKDQIMSDPAKDHERHRLIVNKIQKEWPHEFITGSEIKELAGSPHDWVVNQKYPHSDEDPEIGNDQKVDLRKDAPPAGEKRFTTRKPKTSPGQ